MQQWIEEQTNKAPKPVTAIGTGGNIGKLYELGSGDKNKKEKQIISLKKLEETQMIIKGYTYEERVNILMMNTDRADVIVPASDIYLNIMRWAKATKMLVPELGLKDGLMLMLYERNTNKTVGGNQVLNFNKYKK